MGDYNQQKVAFTDFPLRVYEIQCGLLGVDTGNGKYTDAPSPATLSFEACLKACNVAARDATFACIGVLYYVSGTCRMSNTFYANTPVQMNVKASASANQYSARLLNAATYPKINDYVTFMSQVQDGTQDLGFCRTGTTANANYNMSFVAIQYKSNIQYSGDTANFWQIGCGGTTFRDPRGALAGNTQTDGTSWASLNGYTAPTNADRCGRLCHFHRKAGATGACQAWEWRGTMPLGGLFSCTFYSIRWEVTSQTINGQTTNLGASFASDVLAAGGWASGRLIYTSPSYRKRDVPWVAARHETEEDAGAIANYKRVAVGYDGYPSLKPDVILPAI
jgi:hypothetical protein